MSCRAKTVMRLHTLLIAASLLPIPALANENWLVVGSSGEGLQQVTTELDLNSSKQQANGVTTYKWRIKAVNPFTLNPIFIDMADGIDCKRREYVYLKTGKREPITPKALSETSGTSTPIVAYRNFCPK